MDQKKLIEEIKSFDRAVSAMTANGHFRMAAIRNTNTVKTAQMQHELSHIPAYYLAKHLTSAQLMASFLKGEERIIIETETNGLIQKLYSEAIQVGEARGYVDYDEKLLTGKVGSEKDILGIGLLKVQKILYNKSEPFTGVVELQFSDIAADMAYYYHKSEQIPTAVIIDADFDDKGILTNSGGLILQAMPDAGKEEIDMMMKALEDSSKLMEYFRDNQTPDKIMKDIFPVDIKILKSIRLDFFCRCSKESFMQKLIALGQDELKDMQEKGNNELVCRYCNKKYTLDDNDFESLFVELNSMNN